jgi:hypothetical protein
VKEADIKALRGDDLLAGVGGSFENPYRLPSIETVGEDTETWGFECGPDLSPEFVHPGCALYTQLGVGNLLCCREIAQSGKDITDWVIPDIRTNPKTPRLSIVKKCIHLVKVGWPLPAIHHQFRRT